MPVLIPEPDPEMYRVAVTRLGVSAKECVIVEDNEHGIRAARDSGAHVLAVQDITEVNYNNIKRFIALLDKEQAA